MSNNDRELRGRIAELERRFINAPPTGGAVVEAPADGNDYVRVNATWRMAAYFSGAYGDLTGKPALGGMASVNDAPSDGQEYVRLDGAWSVVSASSGVPPGGLTGEVLTKLSDTDGDAVWEPITITLSGGDATT